MGSGEKSEMVVGNNNNELQSLKNIIQNESFTSTQCKSQIQEANEIDDMLFLDSESYK